MSSFIILIFFIQIKVEASFDPTIDCAKSGESSGFGLSHQESVSTSGLLHEGSSGQESSGQGSSGQGSSGQGSSGQGSSGQGLTGDGCLVLSDGVVFANRDLHADIIVDMCTLTGAQVNKRRSFYFCSAETLNAKFAAFES